MREGSAAPTYVGLDIGTSTVRCVVGVRDQNDPGLISVIGHGSSPNQGMRKGVVMHIDDAAEAIIQAITEAERISGRTDTPGNGECERRPCHRAEQPWRHRHIQPRP
ncbi:MAG: hypothetical protein WDN27_03410 [Candidatus Saccharibacteria bacterium]